MIVINVFSLEVNYHEDEDVDDDKPASLVLCLCDKNCLMTSYEITTNIHFYVF